MPSDLPTRARRTAKARFVAAQRFELHNLCSRCTVAIASIALLTIPLLQAFDLSTNLNSQQLNVIQILLAVVILVFSLLLSGEEYAVKANRMHRCGIELNALAQKSRELNVLAQKNGKQVDDEMQLRLLEQYHNVIQRCDNHQQIDFDMQKLQNHKDYFETRFQHWWATIQIRPRYWLRFSLYLVVPILIIVTVVYVFFPAIR